MSVTYRIIWTRSSIFCYSIDMNKFTRNLPVCNSGQHTCVAGLFNFFFVLKDLIDRIDSYFQRIAFQRNLLLIGLTLYVTSFSNAKAAFIGMALCKLARRNYGGKWPVSIRYQNLHSFKEGLVL